MTEVEQQPKVEQSEKEEVSGETEDKALSVLHPLKRRWTYWYLNDDRQVQWEDRLKKVCTFETVEEFWALYNNIRPPSGLNNTCDYNVFKDNIQPMWEVPENANGGRWLINIEKGTSPAVMDLIWLEILIAMIGEQFGEEMEQICGLVCNVRNKGSKISVWTRDCNAEESILKIGMVIKQKLTSAVPPKGVESLPRPLVAQLKYEDHASCQNKSGSTIKCKHTINLMEPST